MDGRFVIAPFAFADLYVLRRDNGSEQRAALPGALQPSFRGDLGDAALFPSRRSARRPTLGLGSLSVLDAVRCCTARGSKLKVSPRIRIARAQNVTKRGF